MDNFTPVSLTGTLCKVLEKLNQTHVCQYLAENSVVCPVQYGFMKNRFCLTNLLSFLDELTQRLDEDKHIGACYLDFMKAFDSAVRRLLLSRLGPFGIRRQVCHWVKAFLARRSFYSRVGDKRSTKLDIRNGIPQRSMLGPLMFPPSPNDVTSAPKYPGFSSPTVSW